MTINNLVWVDGSFSVSKLRDAYGKQNLPVGEASRDGDNTQPSGRVVRNFVKPTILASLDVQL